MFKALWSIGNDGFDKIEALRRDVNVKGRGIAEDEEFDAVDSLAGHVYVCLQTGEPIAAGRMYPDISSDSILIDRIAVMPEYESQPYAELVLRMLLFKAQQLPQKHIRIIAEDTRFELVERFGFEPVTEPVKGRGGLVREYRCPTGGIIWDSMCKHMH